MGFNSPGFRALTNIYGPSSLEGKVSDFIVKQIKSFVDEITVDRMGNVIARKIGKGPKLMIAGHMDSIGMMVTEIDDKGFIRLTNIGGINPYVTHGERLMFKDGTIGVACAEGSSDMGKLTLDKIFVDIGAKNKEEALETVGIGDICVYAPNYSESDHTVTTASIDDRIGCFVMMEALRRIETVANDTYFVFTVQEEVGTRGGHMTAYAIQPDFGLAVDITASGDTPGAKRFAIKLHDGVAIKVRDNSLLSHPGVNAKLIELCKENDIKYQMEVLEFGGTDAGAISLSREGIPSSCLSIPTRYVHSAHETASKFDIECAVTLLTKVVETPFIIK